MLTGSGADVLDNQGATVYYASSPCTSLSSKSELRLPFGADDGIRTATLTLANK
jgi:hypothetical protein